VRSVLFICHGNIIRSVFAQKQFEKQMLTSPICARSAGLFAKEGKAADPRAIEAARLLYDLDLSSHSASPLTSKHVGEADAIFVMDRRNEAQLLERFPGAAQRVFLLAQFSKSQTHPNLELPDPYTGSLEDVVACCRSVAECIGGLIDTLQSRDDRSHGPQLTGTARMAGPRAVHGDGDETAQR
jgi:protein-tyrosine-phosphatase